MLPYFSYSNHQMVLKVIYIYKDICSNLAHTLVGSRHGLACIHLPQFFFYIYIFYVEVIKKCSQVVIIKLLGNIIKE